MVSFYLCAWDAHGSGELSLQLLLQLDHRYVRQVVRDPVLGEVRDVQVVVPTPSWAQRLDVGDQSMKQFKVLDGPSTLDGSVVACGGDDVELA